MLKKAYDRYKKYIMYLIIGGCTTAINMIIFMGLRRFNISLVMSNTIAFMGAVIFAYIFNKRYVFKIERKQNTWKKTKEFMNFIGMRCISFLIETLLLVISISISDTEIINKIIIAILIIIMNYIISSKYIFK